MVYRFYADGYLRHSSGPWKKHKYIKKIGNKYVYANSGGSTSSTSSYKLRGEAAGKKARAFIETMKSKVAEYHSIGKQLVDGFLAGLFGKTTVAETSGPISANISQSHAWQKQGFENKPNSTASRGKTPTGRPHSTTTPKKDYVNGGGSKGSGKRAGSALTSGVQSVTAKRAKSNKTAYSLSRYGKTPSTSLQEQKNKNKKNRGR